MSNFQELPKFSGARVRRREDPDLMTGRGRYVADIKLPDTLQMALVRSPYAHARILDIDSSAALELDGVVAVLTGADVNPHFAHHLMPRMPLDEAPFAEGKMAKRYPLAKAKVHYVGEPVALVLAEDAYTALDAVELVYVDYDPLEVVITPEAALAADAPIIHEEYDSNLAFRWGPIGNDTASIFASAAHTANVTATTQRVIPNAIEPRAALGQYDNQTGTYTVWATTQSAHGLKGELVAQLAVAPEKVRVIAPEVGGGFGVKGNLYGEPLMVALLAQRFNRPVRWVASRSEDYLATSHGRGQTNTMRLAADENGRLLAADFTVSLEIGAFYGAIAPIIPRITISMMTGVYDIPTIRAEACGVFTNKHPSEPYRGAGRPDAAYLIERAMDALADEIGLDPAELRRRNFIPPEQFPYTTAAGTVYDSGDYLNNMETALRLSDYASWRERQAAARQHGGKLIGIGLATYVEVCAGGPWEASGVEMDAAGKVTIRTGSSPHGQGHETTWAQIAADALQLPLADITVLHGDTAQVPRGIGTFGSRSTALAGSAVRVNSETVRDKGRHIAAHLLEASPLDVEMVAGRFQVVGVPERGLSWAEVAAAATAETLPAELHGGLAADEDFVPENALFPFGTHVAVIAIEPETGELEILQYLTVDDCGRAINPLLVEGQVHGGLAQGLGQALWEAAQYDELGNLLTGSALDYAIPRADNFPVFQTHRTETPTPFNPLGVKGVGEAATIGSMPTMVNAVVDALSSRGIRHIDMPLTAEKLWRLLQE